MTKKYLALVVEDDPDLSTIFASALESAGFQVEVINDGGKALARLVEDPIPHLMILDLHLPHLSGANTLRQIHSDRRLIETRVVICTADAAMANELGTQADLVLLKPVMYSQMRDLAIRLVPGVLGPGGTGELPAAETRPAAPAEAKPPTPPETKAPDNGPSDIGSKSDPTVTPQKDRPTGS